MGLFQVICFVKIGIYLINIYANPRMVTNTLWLRGVPKCDFFVSLPLSIRMGTPHMVTGTVFLAIHLVTH
jgi:hypothetical protein